MFTIVQRTGLLDSALQDRVKNVALGGQGEHGRHLSEGLSTVEEVFFKVVSLAL